MNSFLQAPLLASDSEPALAISTSSSSPSSDSSSSSYDSLFLNIPSFYSNNIAQHLQNYLAPVAVTSAAVSAASAASTASTSPISISSSSYSTSQSPFILPSSLNSTIPLFTSLCHDHNGWAILDPRSALNPCFIDSTILLFPSLLLLLFGFFKTYSQNESNRSYRPWYYYSKIVCI